MALTMLYIEHEGSSCNVDINIRYYITMKKLSDNASLTDTYVRMQNSITPSSPVITTGNIFLNFLSIILIHYSLFPCCFVLCAIVQNLHV